LFACFLSGGVLTGAVLGDENQKIRIGVYDSRAIAIAYAPSKYNPVSEKMKEYRQAKADDNQKKMKELEEWGQKHQRQLHRQGFSFVPVGDLLENVKDQMSAVAKKAKVVAIVRKCDFVGENVEVVDVTDQLVELFGPSEKTWKTVRSIKDKPAVDLDEIEKHNKKDDF
jgi:hypothetical protein